MAAEATQTLGEFLRLEREKRGITIEQVASATRIAVRMLHALESDQYGEMPAKPFVRGFVISYSRFIGLDSKEVLTRFGAYIEEKAHDRPVRDHGHSGYVFERRETERSRLVLSIVLGSFLIVGGVLFVVLKPSLHKSRKHGVDKLKMVQEVAPSPLPSPSPSPVALASVEPISSPVPTRTIEIFKAPATPVVLIHPGARYTPPPPSPSPMPEAKPVVPAVKEPVATPTPTASPTTSPDDPLNSGMDIPKAEIRHKAIFRALEDVWVRYQSDNRKPMRFPLRKDKVLVLRARDVMKFQASDPKAIQYQYAGRPAKVLAEEKSAVMRQGDLTLVIPFQVSGTIKEAFPGAKTIFMSPVPRSANAPAPSTSGE